jgi:hypothetical protein
MSVAQHTEGKDNRLLAIEATLSQSDPRNPKRPDGEAGANWAHCRSCDRGGPGLSFIRHRAGCSWNRAAISKTTGS